MSTTTARITAMSSATTQGAARASADTAWEIQMKREAKMSSPWERERLARQHLAGMGMPGDPWSQDYFAPASANPISPYTNKPYARPVPEIDDLFAIQKRLIQVLQAQENDDDETARVHTQAAYRQLNRYLRHYNR